MNENAFQNYKLFFSRKILANKRYVFILPFLTENLLRITWKNLNKCTDKNLNANFLGNFLVKKVNWAVLNKTSVQSFCDTQKINTKKANLIYIFCRKSLIRIAACRNFWEKSKANWKLFCDRENERPDRKKVSAENC